MKVSKSPSEALALTNCILVNPNDFPANVNYILIENKFAFTIKRVPEIPAGDIGTSLFHRRFAQLSLNQDVFVKPFDPANAVLGNLTLQLSFLRKNTEANEYFDTSEMAKAFMQSFNNQVFSKTQTLAFDFHGITFAVLVADLDLLDVNALKGSTASSASSGFLPGERGVLISQTAITFTKAPDCAIRLKGAQTQAATQLIQPNFKFEELGIGGLDKEFQNIFRRAFASRIFPPHIVEKLGIQHVKGILLFGPPGTGKTLMARQIGKMLNAREPLIVNGPEILNKFVGQSEENVRKLFGPAEEEYKAKGEESGLHIIIFDELDAICKQRGARNDGTGVGDSIVNQLLSKMDGVNQLNNILIIGMTNRLDMIDEALLRPGRLEIHMEIGLPDESGRLQIIKVHTTKMTNNNLLHQDVDLAELASLTKNFSGAEIAGLIKSAASFAFNRHVNVENSAKVTQDYEKMKIQRDDFMRALDEVHASFGVSESELQSCLTNGIIHYSAAIERILADGRLFVDQVKNSSRTPLVSVLLHGPSGSGKTALACSIAMQSDYPFIKLISPESMVGFSENAKMQHIYKIFSDAYKSPFSVIVVDSIERILDWVPIGPRFSNTVLQTLLVLLKKQPPKDKKLLILATTSQKNILQQMDMGDVFNSDIYVPNVTTLDEMAIVLRELKLFNDSQLSTALNTLRASGGASNLSVGIKKLLMMIEMARQDEDTVDKFVSCISDQYKSSYV